MAVNDCRKRKFDWIAVRACKTLRAKVYVEIFGLCSCKRGYRLLVIVQVSAPSAAPVPALGGHHRRSRHWLRLPTSDGILALRVWACMRWGAEARGGHHVEAHRTARSDDSADILQRRAPVFPQTGLLLRGA